MQRLLVFLLALLVASTAFAEVKLRFNSPGGRAVWTASDLTVESDGAAVVEESEYAYSGLLKDYMLVLDRETGNVAYKRTRDIDETWSVAKQDYKLIGEIRVAVQYEGRGVTQASIRVNSGVPKLVDPETGRASFHNVRPGDVAVEVSYRSEGRDRVRRQKFEAALDRDEPIPQFVVAITDPVATIAPAPLPTPNAVPAADTKPVGGSPNVLGSIVMFLLILGAAAAVLYLGLRWVKNNEEKAQAALGHLGVTPGPVGTSDPVPDPADPPPAPASVDPGPIAPILLDPLAGSVAPPIPVGAQEPRFVGSGGIPRLIPLGVTVVSREPGSPLGFDGESTISRRHAEVERTPDGVFVTDLGSTNGTFVQGRRITDRTELNPGDEVQFGAVRVRFE